MRALVWFRKDLRLDDHTALIAALHDADGDVVPFYASDPAILGRDDIAATRVRFVLESLADLARAIEQAGSRLVLDHGPATETVVRAARAARADAVYWNDEYEPALRTRDHAVATALTAAGVAVRRFDDRHLVPPDALRTSAGKPYTVFTPFAKACEARPTPPPGATATRLAAHDVPTRKVATLGPLGFSTEQERWPGGARAAETRLERFLERGLLGYPAARDRLDADAATSRLSADLTFGTISPRRIVERLREAVRADRSQRDGAIAFVRQLRWRDFYAHVLFHFPHVETGAFRREYDAIRWHDDADAFAAWTEGRTGFPIVDAGMRQLRATGFMHNRARMIVASFLTKDLLLDWRLGERHFMRSLVDGDLANNNGGWQWAAGTGTDAQPWFRVFNPVLQGRKFDPEGTYVRRWVPELARVPARHAHAPWEAPEAALEDAGVVLGVDYPRPIVDHAECRERALEAYREATASADAPGPPGSLG
jgi:deoxyribodipyrimidine photo-lyase